MSEALDYSSFEKRYKDKEYIGSGGFGKVYKVFDHAKNHYVALKVSDVRPEWKKFTLKNEVELVNRMDKHRNIARYDACYRYNTRITGEMDFAILKFYEDGNLEQFLKKQDLSKEAKRVIIQGVLEGIQFLHRNNVIHRDLKAQNILMSREDGVWCPKITDFGLSREVSADSVVTNSAVGISYAYAAPEQILNQKIYKNVDLWATGVMIYRIIQGELPFKGRGGDDKSAQSQLELSNKIVNLELPAALESMEEPYRAMIKACLIKDPAERVQTPDELLDIFHGRKTVFEDIQPPVTSAGHAQPVVDSADEKTQLIINEKERLDTSYEPPSTPPPAPVQPVVEEVIPPAQPPEPDLSRNYQVPEKNVTQIIQETPVQKEEREEKEAEPAVFQPNTGGDSGGFNLRHVFIILAVLVAAGAAYWVYTNPGLIGAGKEALPQADENQVLVPVKKELSRYDELDLSGPDLLISGKLQNALAELKALSNSPESSKNYRIDYLKGKLTLLEKESKKRDFLASMESAANTALSREKGAVMLKDMVKDEDQLFRGLREKLSPENRFFKKWEEIKNKLR